MPIEIRMPALSPTMTEGNLARWLKKEGDSVHSGDVIAEIETDKATMEYEAADEGRLGKIIVPEGAQGIKVNQPIALLLEEGEDPAELEKFAGTAQPAAGAPRETPPVPAEPKTEPVPAAKPAPAPENGRVFASPLARRMAVHAGLDLASIRSSLNAKVEERISINDFVIRAVALALRQVPAANASWSEDAILLWERADIAVAVALDDGLITPIVKGADQKGLAQIATEMKDLAERARAGKLKLEEFQGGTFTISNLGMYGIREFAAVINPPQGGILAVGTGEQRPVVRDGQLTVATVMTCTLSGDHRAVDGAVGAQFLGAFKKLVEDPLTMLL